MADACIKAIDKAESNFHKALETSYNTMGDTTFKALRRILPITRQKINWTNIQSLKSGGDAGGKAAATRVSSFIFIVAKRTSHKTPNRASGAKWDQRAVWTL